MREGKGEEERRGGERGEEGRTCFSSIFPFFNTTPKTLAASSPHLSLTTESSTLPFSRRQTVS